MNVYQGSGAKRSNVLQFPYDASSGTSSPNIEAELLDQMMNPDAEKRLKSIVESAVIDAWMKARLFDFDRSDDPFDSIYFSELMPDKIHENDIIRISHYSDLEDLSETISFIDEWEE